MKRNLKTPKVCKTSFKLDKKDMKIIEIMLKTQAFYFDKANTQLNDQTFSDYTDEKNTTDTINA